jgi:hypothetical protein
MKYQDISRNVAPEEARTVDGEVVVNLDGVIRMALSKDAKAPTAVKIGFLRQMRSQVYRDDPASCAKLDRAIAELQRR